MRPRGAAPGRGFTLVEVIVVMMLAGLGTLGLVTFYMQSQGTWLDASSQALAQRDATSVLEDIGNRAGMAHSAMLIPVSGHPDNYDLFFFDTSGSPIAQFFWDPDDSLIYFADGGSVDRRPVVASVIERFSVRLEDTLGLVHVDSLRVRSTMGQSVLLSSTFGMYNWEPTP